LAANLRMVRRMAIVSVFDVGEEIGRALSRGSSYGLSLGLRGPSQSGLCAPTGLACVFNFSQALRPGLNNFALGACVRLTCLPNGARCVFNFSQAHGWLNNFAPSGLAYV